MAKPQASTGIKAEQATYKGITIKVTDYYDGTNDFVNTRFDVLTGWAAPYAELACKYAL
jgi:hypothetical protein